MPERYDDDEDKDCEKEARDEASFIAELEYHIQIPTDLEADYDRWDGLRRYVSNLGHGRDTPDCVSTNFLLRTQAAVLANILPKDPVPVIVPDEVVPISEQVPPEQMSMAVQALGPDAFNDYPHAWTVFTKTQELCVKKQQALSGLNAVMRGMAQDALTLPIAWVKMRWIDDYNLDPIGMRHESTTATMAARYDSLKASWDDGDFDDMDSRHYEMQELNRILKDIKLEELALDLAERPPEPKTDLYGTPIAEDPRQEDMADLQSEDLLATGAFMSVPHYQGYIFESVDAEDMRFDWRVTKPEDMRFARWQAQRVFMPPEEVIDEWSLDSDKADKILRNSARFDSDGSAVAPGIMTKAGDDERNTHTHNTGGDTAGPSEGSSRGAFVAVWEFWDRRKGKVYRWAQGSRVLLDSFAPEGTPRRFFPFFALQFNRVTGKIFAPADSELLKPLQEELNMLRTHDREARKSSYPRYMVTKGTLNKQAKREMRKAVPYSVIEIDKASDVKDNIFPLIPATYNPRLYDGSLARQDFEAMAGLSQASLGITGGAGLATEVATANQQLGVQSAGRKDTLIGVYTEIYEAMVQMNSQRLGEDNAKALAGPGATMLSGQLERSQVLNNYIIGIEAAPSDAAEEAANLKKWMDTSTVIGQLMLPLNKIELSKQFLRDIGVRNNLSRFVDVGMLLAMATAPAEGAPQRSGNANKPAGGRPDQQAGEGAGGGRPPQSEQPGPPSPESIPNRPQI